MDEHAHLHDGETLLCSVRASIAGLLSSLARGLLEGLLFGAIVGMAGAFGVAALGWSFGPWIGAALGVIALGYVLYHRVHLWKTTKLRITTERILVPEPGPFLHPPLHTVKWPQYQESHVGHKKPVDFLFGSNPLFIRYGTADAHKEVRFPSLRYAEDIKHYLDKVDSAVRRGDVASLKPFIAKPKGKRDTIEG